MKGARLALFGGTFDPIHCAHLTVAREAAARFALDRVLFVPAANPPHKSATESSYEDRLEMVRLACAGEPLFEPSDMERGTGKSYSIDTIQRARAKLSPGDRLFFLIGADAFADLATWHRAAAVIRSVEFIVVTRPGHPYQSPPGARIHRLDTLALPVSSSEIRERLARGMDVPELPPPVLDYIRRRRLYTR